MQGFQSYYGIPYSNDMWIDPANKLAKNILLREGLTLKEVKAGHKKRNWVPLMRNDEVIEYPADQTTLTKRYTEESIRFIQANKQHSFFLYLPHTMVHRPLAVSKAFEGRTAKLIWDAIEEVDWSVGEILKAVAEAGIDEKTLVIFTRDNGAAVGSSLPLRARKASVYDGGIREPTLMRWPGQIPAGSVCTEVAASIDILPTLAGLADAKLPDRKIDGRDIWPLMSGKNGAKSPHDTYVLMHGPGTVRSGKWKFYPWQEGKGGGANNFLPKRRKLSSYPVQLYDTVADIAETTNLAEEYPEVVTLLQAAYNTHLAEITANRRPTAEMTRPKGAPSASRPGTPRKKKRNNKGKK
jgi:arylsulfatase A